MLCASEWPTFQVGWPSDGSFSLRVIQKEKQKGFASPGGHPEKVPYIIVWESLVTDPLPWSRPFVTNLLPELVDGQAKVFAITETPKKKIYRCLSKTDF